MTGVQKPIVAGAVLLTPQLNPASGVAAISGVRIHDVGQGDGISVLDSACRAFVQIDYGGWAGHPFHPKVAVDTRMPLSDANLLMLTHWDQDHWCSAPRGTQAVQSRWLVPRQTTSPTAVQFSLTVPHMECVPEDIVGQPVRFVADNGDAIIWQKLKHWPGQNALSEDCNFSGIAYAIVKNGSGSRPPRVILLPGDVPYDEVSFYEDLRKSGMTLHGIMAFHHGSGHHWSTRTRTFLKGWKAMSKPLPIVFSCAANNPFGHPHVGNYPSPPATNLIHTTHLRAIGQPHFDLLF